jgi:hypothetical protein
MATRTVNGREVWSDIQRRLPENMILTKYGITKTQLHQITEKLKTSGLLKDGQRCPACGFIREIPFDECPSCGVILSKFKSKGNPRRSLLKDLWRKMVVTLDKLDTELYRWLRG